ncbi:GNAT family N-acetyltransferase [Clostridioides difficile]
MCNKFNLTEITVNSSPYAVEVYHKLGFKDTAVEQIVDGIRFTPMKLLI